MQIFIKSSLFILLLCWQGLVSAAELPPGWPWRGVSVNSLSATPQDITRLKSKLGLNLVRLQLQPRALVERRKIEGAAAWNESLRWLDGMLDACKREKIGCVVNISQFLFDPRSSVKQQHEPKFWEDDVFTKEVLAWVERLALHTRNRGDELIAFDIISEPKVWIRGPKIPASFNDRMNQIVSSIRKFKPDVWVIISPAPMASPLAYKSFTPIDAERLIYDVHMYSPMAFSHQGVKKWNIGGDYPGIVGEKHWDKTALITELGYIRDFQQKHDALIWVGEFSAVRWAEGGEQYIKDLANIFDDYGWGWSYFSGTGWHGWNPDYNQNYPGRDKGSKGDWKKDYVGEKSVRWNTLREIFHVTKDKLQP